MLTVEEALAQIMAQVAVLPAERVPLLQATGRVLAEDVYADMDAPPFDNSAVDGYAVRAEDTTGANADRPLRLRTLEEIPAGHVPTETIVPGTAAKIMTGAMVPPGADGVVMVEDTREETPGEITILEAARAGQHIRHAGSERQHGDLALPSGTWLRAAAIGLLATCGKPIVTTVRPPRVAVVSTGDEVVDIVEGEPPPAGKIRNSNLYGLAALVQEVGATLHSLTHLPDDLTVTTEALRRLAEGTEGPDTGADVILTAGGVSVGDRDFIKPALETLGTLALWRVAMKPGKPLAFGRIGRTLFFGLPGNPVSAQVTFELFARPALWKMAGRNENTLTRRKIRATLTEAVPHAPGRREYVRGFVMETESGFLARTTGGQDSSRLASLLYANALLVIPQEAEDMAAGEIVDALLIE